jgi:flagellar biosynthesis protein FlhA
MERREFLRKGLALGAAGLLLAASIIVLIRLVLSNAMTESGLAAGSIIKNFSDFVAGGYMIVWFIVFVIIFIIQLIIIAIGSQRIIQSTGYFILDNRYGYHVITDADRNAGKIDEKEAKRRHEIINQTDNFCRAMFDTGVFVQDNIIAIIVITHISIVASLFIEMLMYEMQLQEAVTIISILTIGDGALTLLMLGMYFLSMKLIRQAKNKTLIALTLG